MMSRLCSEEEIQFIKNNAKGKTSIELTELFNKKFGRNLTQKQIAQIKISNKLTSGIKTQFKKGQKPHNYKSVGSEFVDKFGYTWIKVAEPNEWRHKQLFIWEQVNGKIPDGYSVIFLNKDKTDFSLENLMLVRDKEKLVMKNKKLLYEDRELTKTGLLIAEIINKCSEIKNGGK